MEKKTLIIVAIVGMAVAFFMGCLIAHYLKKKKIENIVEEDDEEDDEEDEDLKEEII